MKVLGFDPSLTNFGWCLLEHTEGTIRVLGHGRFRTSARDLFIDRYTELRESVRALIIKECPDCVSCEYPIFHDLFSEGMYGLFLFTCEALRQQKKDVVFFSPGQVKVHARAFLGRPDGWVMAKSDMVEAQKVFTGDKPWNHNEADAFWVAKTGMRFWLLHRGETLESDLTKDEAKQFVMAKTFKKGKKAGQTEKSGILYREDDRFFLFSKE